MDGRRASRAIQGNSYKKCVKSSVDYSSFMSYDVADIVALVSWLKHPVAFWAILSAPSDRPHPAWLGYKFRVDNRDTALIQFRPIRVCSPI